jgi:Kinesin motor domain
LLMYGLQRRKMFSTLKNQESSRSHTIFQIKMCIKTRDELKVISKFSLVDLAGSERLNDLEKTAERIEEAKYINKSLSALGNVIAALKHEHLSKDVNSTKKHFHIPYRDSRLTHILKDSLGGNSLTHIIITLSPTLASL